MIQKNKTIWVTSDTHYGHINIARGISKWTDKTRCRPFDTVEEMNEVLVQNINSVVKENDVLIHCGDFSFGGRQNIEIFRKRLIVKELHLVLGNHDQHIRTKNEYRSFFSSTHDILTLSVDKNYLVLCHFPIASWENLSQASMMLHGHLHSSPINTWRKGRALDVGIDGNTWFRPYNLREEIIPFLLEKPIESFLSDDHHKKS